MSPNLPHPLPAYFKAANAHDVEASVACFADDAIVRDEGKDIRGSAAIREWKHRTNALYRTAIETIAVEQVDDETIVTAQVSGTFPGSPVRLRYCFRLDGGKIAVLEIRA
jgi:ketosteroid isomerase-like protein